MLKAIQNTQEKARPTTPIGEVLEQLSDHRIGGGGLTEFSFPVYGEERRNPAAQQRTGLGFGTRTDAA